MKKLSPEKRLALDKIVTQDGIISALAIDQRGALKKMITNYKDGVAAKDIEDFKVMVSQELTPFASSILLDPEYGLPAASVRATSSGLLLAYEKTGYDATTPGRLPDLLPTWSVKRLKVAGADACKFLLYYDVDEDVVINDRKHAFIERLGSECEAEGLPFFLELVSYDAKITDATSAAYAKVKPHKVNEMMRIFSEPQYQVDVLKVEVPVNMTYVEGFATSEVVYTKAQAMQYFAEQSASTELPFIFLSAGVSAHLFQETLHFAKASGSTFNGVLCGRATWANAVEPFIKEGSNGCKNWLQNRGKANIEHLNQVLELTASSLYNKVN